MDSLKPIKLGDYRYFLGLVMLLLVSCTNLEKNAEVLSQEEKLLESRRAIVAGYLNRGEPGRAIRELRTIMKNDSDNSELLGLLGLSFLALNNAKSAVEPLTRAHRLAPSATTALNLSSAYIETAQYQKAERTLQDVVKDKQTFSQYQFPERLIHNLGLAKEKQRQFKAAIYYYSQALKENPGFYLSMMQLGSLYGSLGKTKLAQQQFKEAHRLCQKCLPPVEKLSQTLMSAGQPQRAHSVLKSYVSRKDLDNASRQKANGLMELAAKASLSAVRSTRSARGTTGTTRPVRLK